MNDDQPTISVVLPCRNEQEAIGLCLEQIRAVLASNNLAGEIIVSDSSHDRSPEIAKEFGVKLVKHNQVGYGSAYLEAFKVIRGNFIFMADADGTYDFKEIPRFVKQLAAGDDLVIGNRFAGEIEKGAMPFFNRYLGNPFLSFLFRLFFRQKISDINCGLRAIRKEALAKLNLRTAGMEFASEMIIQAVRKNLRIKELPINYYPRQGKSKLKPLADGWRHLRFMLLYSPLFLFFLPGIFLFGLGILSLILLYYDAVIIFGLKFQFHPMFLAALLAIIGYQLIFFALFAKTYALTHLGEKNRLISQLHRYITIEKASIFGLLISLPGFIIYLAIFIKWLNTGFGPLLEVKNSIVALTSIIIGLQTIFSAFMLSILGIKER